MKLYIFMGTGGVKGELSTPTLEDFGSKPFLECELAFTQILVL